MPEHAVTKTSFRYSVSRALMLLASTYYLGCAPLAGQTIAPPNSVFKAGVVYGLGTNTSNIGTGNAVGGYFGNGGGKLFDVAVTNGTGNGGQLFVFSGFGDGSFAAPVSSGTLPVVQDGLNLIVAGPVVGPSSFDLVVTDDFGNLLLMRGNGDGTFQNPVSLGQVASTLSAYVNSGGTLNLVLSNATFPTTAAEVSVVTVLSNNGAGTFTASSITTTTSSSAANVTAAYPLNVGGLTAVLQVNSDGTAKLSQLLSGVLQTPLSLGTLGTPNGVGSGPISVFTSKGTTYFAGIATFAGAPTAFIWPLSIGGGGIAVGGPAIYNVPTNDAASLTVADVDGDGNPDLIVLGGGQFSTAQTVNLFLSNSAQGFSPLFGKVAPNIVIGPGVYGIQAIVADANGDGENDLLLYEPKQGLTVMLNQGKGTFLAPTTSPAGNKPVAIAKADFNGDGLDDLAVANGINSFTEKSDNTVSVFLSKSAGVYAPQITYPVGADPIAVTTGNVNGEQSVFVLSDGDTSGNLSNPVVTFLQGSGAGTFQAPAYFSSGTNTASASVSALAVGVFDASGSPTVAVANSDGTINLFTYQGGGFRASIATPKLAVTGAPSFGLNLSSLAVGDIDGDGNMDLVATLRGVCGYDINFEPALNGGAVVIFRGLGNGRFSAPVYVSSKEANSDPAFVTLGSFTSTTLPSMLVVDAAGGTCSVAGSTGPYPLVFANNGGLSFAETDLANPLSALSASFTTVSLKGAIGDINGDGSDDIILSEDGLVTVLLNPGTGIFNSTAPVPTIYVGSSDTAGLVAGSLFGPGGHDAALASASGVALMQGMNSPAVVETAHLVLGTELETLGSLTGNANIVVGLTLANGSDVTATNVKISANLPPGMAFVSGGLVGLPCTSVSATQVACTLASLAPLANPGVIPFTVTTAAAGTYTIAFTVSADQAEGIPASDAMANIALQITAAPAAHLVLAAQLESGGMVNSNATISLTLMDGSDVTATNIKIVATLPAGLLFVFGGSAAVSCSSVTVTQVRCTSASLAPLAKSGLIPFVVTSSQAGTYTIAFSVTSDEPEGVPASDALANLAVAFSPAQADLMLGVTTSPAPAFQNAALTYLFTVTNNGPSIATDASITFIIPPTLSSPTATPSQGSCALIAGDRTQCNLGTIVIGATASFSLVVTPTLAGSLTISFSASEDQVDTDAVSTISSTVQINPSLMIQEAIAVSDAVFISPLLTNFAPPAAYFSTAGLGFNGTPGQVQTLTMFNVGGSPLVFSGTVQITPGFTLTSTVCSDGLNSLPASLPSGGQCSFTICYAGTSPNGTITFTDNAALSSPPSTASGTNFAQAVALNGTGSGTGTIALPSTAVTIPTITEIITTTDSYSAPASTSVLLVSTNRNPNAGTTVTFTATVTPSTSGAPTGTVSFFEGTALLSTQPLNAAGIATFSTVGLVIGQDNITAEYNGDANFLSSFSPVVVETVVSIPPLVRIALPAANPYTITAGTSTYNVTITLVNGGNISIGELTMLDASLGGLGALSFPAGTTLTNLAPGASATINATFSSSAGAAGKAVPLSFSGTYAAGSLSGNWTVSFRSVTLP